MNTPQDPIQFLRERSFIHQSTDRDGWPLSLNKKRHYRTQVEG